MHALDRLGGDSPCDMNLLLGILHFKPEASDNTSNSTPQFSTSKIFADTRPLPVQEGNLRKIGASTSVLVGRLLTRDGIGIDPSLGQELVGIVAPEVRAAVDSVRTEHQTGSRWDRLAGYRCVADRLTDGHGHGGIQP